MVTKMLKLTMRQIRSSLTRFLAIAAIVALGVGFFCGLRLTKTAMVHTLDDYAEAHRMYDFRLVSTVGFDETDADVLAADARIASCEGEKSADALASVADGAAKPCRFLSLPVQINFPGLKCGRLPQTAEECLADGLLYSEKDLGKTVVLTEENDEDTLDSFNRREFTIVGIAKSVLYINYERGGTSIGSGTLSSFVYILPEAFALEYDTSLYLRLAGRQGEVYSDEYTACIDAAEPWVTQLAESAAYGRSDRLYEEAEQTLSDARETLDEKQQELADAKQELADAKQELKDAHQTYADGVVSLADAKQEAEQELADAYQKLVDGQRTIEENEQKLADGEQELADGEKKLADAKQTYEENAAKFEKEKKQAENEMSFAFAKLQKARETLAEQQQQLDAQKAALDKQEAQIDAAVSAGAMSPEAAEAAKAQIAAARGQLAAAQAQLDEGKNALADNENQLDLAADAANEAFAENQKKLDEAKKTLEEKQQELEDAGHDAHACHGGIAVAAGRDVQQHTADAVQALTAKAGCTVEEDEAEVPGAAGDFRDAELAHRPAPQEHGQQDTEADALAQSGGNTCAAGAHAEAEDKDGVQQDIEHAAGDKADHGEAGLALVAEDVVHHEARHHERGRDEDGPRIGAGVGQDGLGAAQQQHEVGQRGKADEGQHHTNGQRREKAGGSEPGGCFGVPAAQTAADDGAGAVAQRKAQSLNNGHQAGNDAYRAGSAGGDLAHKKGVGQIVDAGDQHA